MYGPSKPIKQLVKGDKIVCFGEVYEFVSFMPVNTQGYTNLHLKNMFNKFANYEYKNDKVFVLKSELTNKN